MGTRRVLLVDGEVQVDLLVDEPVAAAGLPTIVLLPSSQRDSFDFDPLAAGLAGQGWRVLRPQPRGMGRSRGPMDELSLHTLAQDVALVIARAGGGRAVVAGHAYGHWIARVAALDHPQAVRGVAVMAAAAREFPAGLGAMLDTAADPAQPEAERLACLRRAFFAPGHDPRPWLEGWHPGLRETYRRAARRPDKSVWWPDTLVPVLDLQAADDPWRPPATRSELQQALGDRVTVRCIGAASHALVVEQPQAVADELTAWAATLPP